MKVWFASMAVFLISVSISIQAQTALERNVTEIIATGGTVYVQEYMQPFATAFGTCVNGAIYHRAYTKSILHFDAGINAVYLAIPDKDKTFTFDDRKVPTVFGDLKNQAAVPGTGVAALFIPALQVNIGFFSGFELTARYMGFKIKEFGDIDLWGGAIKYGLSNFFAIPMIPIDVSAQVLWHSFSLGEWISSGNFGMNFQASAALPVIPVDIYGGVGFENTSMMIKTLDIPGNTNSSPGEITIDGENKMRYTLGIGVTVTVINFHAEYMFGFYHSAGMGLMIVF